MGDSRILHHCERQSCYRYALAGRQILLHLLLSIVLAAPCEGAKFFALEPGQIVTNMSPDGRVLVGTNSGAPSAEYTSGFWWTEETGSVGTATQANRRFLPKGVSGDGSTMVGVADGPRPRHDFTAFSLNTNGTLSFLDRNHPEISISIADDISADGKVIVGGANSSAARWTGDGELELLGGVASEPSYAFAVSDDGKTIVGQIGSGPYHAMRWTDVGAERIHNASLGDQSLAQGVSADGSVIVGTASTIPFNWSNASPFRWTMTSGAEVLTLLPGATSGIAFAVSGDGALTGGSNDMPDGQTVAVVWDRQGHVRSFQEMLSDDFELDLGARRLTQVRGISADGRVLMGNSNRGYWRAVLAVPEPAALAAAAAAWIALSAIGRRKEGV